MRAKEHSRYALSLAKACTYRTKHKHKRQVPFWVKISINEKVKGQYTAMVCDCVRVRARRYMFERRSCLRERAMERVDAMLAPTPTHHSMPQPQHLGRPQSSGSAD